MKYHLKKMKTPGEHMMDSPLGNHELYQPCTTPLSELAPIYSLADLTVDSHHAGRVLIVRSFCTPVRIETIVNAVEDETGHADRLAVYNLASHCIPEKILPAGTIFAIKEPYYRRAIDGGVMLRVDHPTNITLLSSSDPLVPAAWRTEEKSFTALERTEQATIAASQGHWHDAEMLYGDALKLLSAEEDLLLRQSTYRERAHARLHTRHYELAAEDALKGVVTDAKGGTNLAKEGRNVNYQTYYHAGRAHYELGEFAEAKKYFERALPFAINKACKKLASADLKKVAIRLFEKNQGVYDFEAMSASVKANNRQLDHASFVSNTKIDSAGKRGRGLFATKDIAYGDIIMVEKAFFSATPPSPSPATNGNSSSSSSAATTTSICMNNNKNASDDADEAFRTDSLYDLWNQIRGNPRQAAAFLDLHDGGAQYLDGKKLLENVDNQLVFDMFQLRAILDQNIAWGRGVKSSQPQHNAASSPNAMRMTGVWLRASYANHSCLSNANRAYLGDMMIMRATKSLQAGEEILVNYVDPTWHFDKRKRGLAFYGFACDCPLCVVEATLPDEVLERRKKVERDIARFLEEDSKVDMYWKRPPCEHTAKRVDELVTAMQATYDDKLYANLPRFECIDLDVWLCEVSWTAKEALDSATLLLRDMGITITYFKKWDDKARFNLENAGPVYECPLAGLIAVAPARRATDDPRAKMMFWKCKKLAEKIYLILFEENMPVQPGLYTREYA